MGTLKFPTIGKKICKAEGYLIGAVGQGILVQDIDRILETKGHEIDALRTVSDRMNEKDPKYDGEALALTYKKELFHLDCHGLMTPINTNFWAIGCCDQFVLGRLFHVEEMNGKVMIEDAESAIKAAAKYDCGIDDRVQRFYLEGIVS